MTKEPKSPISIEIGAKASLEVKTEIPKEATGRMLDALVDLIRPFTERQGLKGDLIRLQREDVALEIAKKARESAKIKGITLQPVPNKVLIPIFELGSLEEKDSPLIDWWAELLVSAADPSRGARPYLAELISQIGRDEASLLDRIWTGFCRSPGFGLSSGEYRHWFVSDIIRYVDEIVRRDTPLDGEDWTNDTLSKLEEFSRAYVATTEKAGAIVEISLPKGIVQRGIASKSLTENSASLDVCRAINLLGFGSAVHDFDAIGLQQNYQISVINFTDLGIEFMRACRPDAIVGHWCLDE